ncbi:hypothetical protein GTW71_37880 [Streptomyces sp. SID6041]|nr:hypothetical protein [Streptomyces sp. SID6041]
MVDVVVLDGDAKELGAELVDRLARSVAAHNDEVAELGGSGGMIGTAIRCLGTDRYQAVPPEVHSDMVCLYRQCLILWPSGPFKEDAVVQFMLCDFLQGHDPNQAIPSSSKSEL